MKANHQEAATAAVAIALLVAMIATKSFARFDRGIAAYDACETVEPFAPSIAGEVGGDVALRRSENIHSEHGSTLLLRPSALRLPARCYEIDHQGEQKSGVAADLVIIDAHAPLL